MAKNEAIRRVQERLIIRIAAAHETRLARVLSSAYNKGASEIAKDRLYEGSVTKVLMDAEGQLENMYKTAFSAVGELTTRQINGKSRKDSLFERAMTNFARMHAGEKITQITSTTQDRIKNILTSGLEAGLSISEIAAQIRAEGRIQSRVRAHIIARTETHSAAGAGSMETARQSRVVRMKEWLEVDDDRTRDGDNSDFDHTNVEPVSKDMKFLVSGERLDYPGDPAGSPGNIVLCRCGMAFF